MTTTLYIPNVPKGISQELVTRTFADANLGEVVAVRMQAKRHFMFVDIRWASTETATDMQLAIASGEASIIPSGETVAWRVLADIKESLDTELTAHKKQTQTWVKGMEDENMELQKEINVLHDERMKTNEYIRALEKLVAVYMNPSIRGTGLNGVYAVVTPDFLLLEAHRNATMNCKRKLF